MISPRIILAAVGLMTILSACVSQTPSDRPDLTEPEMTQDQFVGKIIEIEPGTDGSTVLLTNERTGQMLDTVISLPNLGFDSGFNFDHIQLGNTLKVYGESFELNDRNRIAARIAKSYVPVDIQNKRATATERALCESLGGMINKAGKAQFDMCVQTFSDTNETCLDASDCFGRCVVGGSSDNLTRGEAITGVCEMNNEYFGCTPLVTNGQYEGTLCVD